ncbi:hypothetical protein K438DRAFT_1767396 [Mycena galopus ATCC 62051]|nr:hypothetical protein K438DRAFT_1767396 [Mycena galopus ATCC 62051]
MSFNRDIILGALLVGTWANSVNICLGGMLLRFETVMDARFCTPSKLFRHLLVFSTIAFDSVSMVANYASVYLYTITHWAWWQLWPKVSSLLDTGSFFFITVAAGGALASGATVVIYPQYKDRSKVTIPATTWLLIEAVTDISIALALVSELRKMKSPVKKNRSLVNRLVAQTIQTGTAGATIALTVLVAYLANKESNGGFLCLPLPIPGSHIPVTTAIAYCIGRVYCITMVCTSINILCIRGVSKNLKLANLNNRKIGKTWSGSLTSSSVNTETCSGRGNQERSDGGAKEGCSHSNTLACSP